jgi:hypothetical protein
MRILCVLGGSLRRRAFEDGIAGARGVAGQNGKIAFVSDSHGAEFDIGTMARTGAASST